MFARMPPDPGLVARVADAIEQLGRHGVRQKNVFSGRGFLVGKSTFVIVWNDDLLVKAPADEYGALLERRGITPFQPDGERPMGTWLVVKGEELADDPELAEWVERGLRGIGR